MVLVTRTLALLVLLSMAAPSFAQFPTASEEHKILKQEAGKWDAEVTMFMGPQGPYQPPQKSKATETNRMLGDFWVLSDFSGEFEGVKFEGHATMGYDPGKKQYTGTWVDSFTPTPMRMTGTYDEKTKTITYDTTSIGMDGNPSKGKNVVVYGEDKRLMTMFVAAPGTDDMIKVMEIRYTKAK